MDPRIDRLRGLLAIGVLLGHAIDLARLSTAAPSGTLFAIALAARPYFGFICVIGFIVLSGYCIARSTMKGFSPGEYAVKRVTRIYPLLIVVALLTALLEWAAFGSPHRPDMWLVGRDVRKFIAALLGFGGFKGMFGALAPSYTISFELMYYAIWGLAMWAAGRGRRALLVSAAVGALLTVFGSWMRDSLGWFAGFASLVGIALFPGWLLGAALALFQEPVTGVARRMPIWAPWIAFVWAHAYLTDVFDLWLAAASSEYVTAASYTVLSGLFTTIVATSIARPAPPPSATDTWLGEMSYPLFLVHGPVIIGVQFALNACGVHLTFAANLAILLAGSFAAAMILVTFVERPVMAWRRSFRARATTARPALAEAATS